MDSTSSTSPKIDVYQIVTNRIINLLEQGTVPWQKPWTDTGIPANFLTKRPYRGINLWLLLSLNFERNLFLTWDQLKKIGGSVKQGEHGHVVIYWRIPPKKENAEADEKEKRVPILRYYKVFNISQCRDLPEKLLEPIAPTEHNPIAECDAIIAGMPDAPPIKYKEQSAYYDRLNDFINMPKKKSFKSIESFYTTLFHELVHSTGAEKRLNRKSITEMYEFGSEPYSFEELVAEMGSAYLSSFTGILDAEIKNTTAYLQGWLQKFKNDKRFIVQASGMAQRAVDYIINEPISTETVSEEIIHAELIHEDGK